MQLDIYGNYAIRQILSLNGGGILDEFRIILVYCDESLGKLISSAVNKFKISNYIRGCCPYSIQFRYIFFYLFFEMQTFYIIENNLTKQVEGFSATQAFCELKS